MPIALHAITPKTAQQPRRRKLHLGHFAFMRAVVQGLDTRASWQRYLQIEGEHDELRNVRRTIAWIRDEFAVAARRSQRFGTARLVLIDAAAVPDKEAPLPSLEAFAAARGLEDFSEAEQIEAYQAEYGTASQRQSRRARVMAKQLDALAWLETLVVHPPLADDAVASWLHPDLAVKMEAAGLHTLRSLIDTINGKGKRWWSGIRAIGAGKAARIEHWLRAHEATIGLTIGRHVAIPRSQLEPGALQRVVPRGTQIVPIDKLVIPAELDGSTGTYRAPVHRCQLRANNDVEAILAWIKSRQGLLPKQKAAIQRKRGIDLASPEAPLDWLHYLSHTQRAYLKEVERYLLWAVIEHKKPLSSMTLDDCEAYRQFMANPLPADRWCGPRGRGQKWSPLWRPFEGPLSAAGQRQAITILKSFYTFLVDQGYLIDNPWNRIGVPKTNQARAGCGRSFTQAQWTFFQDQLRQLADTSANRRLAFSLHLLYATGLRLAEVVASRVDDLHCLPFPADGDDLAPVKEWELRVKAPGGKERRVPVPYKVTSDLAAYLVSRGLDSDPRSPANQGAFLLGRAVDVTLRAPWSPAARSSVDPKKGVSTSTLYDQLKAFFAACAEVLASTDDKEAQKLRAASTSWLRHTHGVHAVAAGIPLDMLQQNMGHASLNTTMRYAAREERRRVNKPAQI